ncbi:MAG: 5-methyltetrahydropteroyltriglutamate--homocysteine S-methyltransferase [Nocardioides sp.]
MSYQKVVPPSIGATVLGYPRIGRDRELKRALESYWAAGATDPNDCHRVGQLDAVATEVRLGALEVMRAADLDTVPVNTFSLYDHVLDTALMCGVIPERSRGIAGRHQVCGFDPDQYFAMARGTDQLAPLEMTKWFDTNYHYLVPEVDAETPFALAPAKVLAEYAEASAIGVSARPVVLGPWTFLRLAKAAGTAEPDFTPLDRLDELTELYVELLARLADAGVEWLQLDEPAAVHELQPAEVADLERVYTRLSAATLRPAILLATYYGAATEVFPALCRTDIDGVVVDLVRGPGRRDIAGIPGLEDKTLVLGVVDGRNVWRNDLSATFERLEEWHGVAAELAISSSCSLLHVPHDVERETLIDPRLRNSLAFADQKLTEVVALQRALEGRPDESYDAFTSSDAAVATRHTLPGLSDSQVTCRVGDIAPGDRERESLEVRGRAQRSRLQLPTLPTTTIGSFPQTAQVRMARAGVRAGRLSPDAYDARMRTEIQAVIRLQERLGLDVLVHGEPERNDMVQYFAEQLAGFVTTTSGWVQSYGSRYVRPPILYGDVSRPAPMTVPWTTYAQRLTERPVKGMLTGPVTMLAWSFVRDDQPPSITADQVALALRDEVASLEASGIAIIQVDEPALRELLPLRPGERRAYLRWAVDAFRLATSGVLPETQIHTHLCYSEFGEVVEAINHLGADVTSVEAARSHMDLLGSVAADTFSGGLGPGVYDIHSPRVPTEAEFRSLITTALRSVSTERLWVNPDCGLKTRAYAEVEPALANMVSAARFARQEIAACAQQTEPEVRG